jgi:hypothetical protein
MTGFEIDDRPDRRYHGHDQCHGGHPVRARFVSTTT